jgi:tetratricopeptide (TPR) repeat protein
MARTKKRTGQTRNRPSAGPVSPQEMQAALEAFLALAESMDDETDESDLDRAQAKAFDAMEAPDRRKRIALAKQALAISRLCADAYGILAREAATPDEALALYGQAVEAGAQALGEAAFKDDVGLFWGLIETRPYMRARHALARTLWSRGERNEAIVHYQDMLRLNPNDNQGIRYSLIDGLLELGRDTEAAGLLKQYGEDCGAAWMWSRALLSFRQKGDTAVSRKALARAINANANVPAYLLGKKALPRTLPHFIGLGDENEAIAYVHDADAAWGATAGAKTWVDAVLTSGSKSPGLQPGPGRRASSRIRQEKRGRSPSPKRA